MSPGWRGDSRFHRSGWPEAARRGSGCMCRVVARDARRGRAVGCGAPDRARGGAGRSRGPRGPSQLLPDRRGWRQHRRSGRRGRRGRRRRRVGRQCRRCRRRDQAHHADADSLRHRHRAGRRPRRRERGAFEGGSGRHPERPQKSHGSSHPGGRRCAAAHVIDGRIDTGVPGQRLADRDLSLRT